MATESDKNRQKESLATRLREAKNLRDRVTLTTPKNEAPTLSDDEINRLAYLIKKVLNKHLH